VPRKSAFSLKLFAVFLLMAGNSKPEEVKYSDRAVNGSMSLEVGKKRGRSVSKRKKRCVDEEGGIQGAGYVKSVRKLPPFPYSGEGGEKKKRGVSPITRENKKVVTADGKYNQKG